MAVRIECPLLDAGKDYYLGCSRGCVSPVAGSNCEIASDNRVFPKIGEEGIKVETRSRFVARYLGVETVIYRSGDDDDA